MSPLVKVPHAQISVLDRETGETTTREPGTRFGLGGITSIETVGPVLKIEFERRWLWEITCPSPDVAEKRARDFAIRAGR